MLEEIIYQGKTQESREYITYRTEFAELATFPTSLQDTHGDAQTDDVSQTQIIQSSPATVGMGRRKISHGIHTEQRSGQDG